MVFFPIPFEDTTMPFNAEQISYAGKAAMDHILRGKPEDLYNAPRPLLDALRKKQKSFPGAKQYVVQKLRKANDSNFQWFGPGESVTYNRKRTLDEASFAWGSAHDGFALDEEELLQNGISVVDGEKQTVTADERQQFVNLMTENTETLRLGFAEKMDYDLHRDGTQDADAIVGLSALVSITPTTGTVGGIDRSTNTFWRNYAATGILSTAGVLLTAMETMWRSVAKVSRRVPDKILAGYKFLDAYRVDAKAGLSVQVMNTESGYKLDGAVSGLSFHGVPLEWDPTLDQMETHGVAAGGVPWDKRAYFLNTNTVHLRPAEGQDMVTRRPPRVYDRYTHYFGLTWRGTMTTSNPAANAVLAIA
jgi:hypothetical protein